MLLNHTLKSLVQGVSQQHEEARHETQVEEMVNCIPDISRGLFRRNPLVSRQDINTSTFNNYDNIFSYSYDRGDDERYLIQINENNELTVVDLFDGTTTLSPITSTYLETGTTPPQEAFTCLTIGDFTFILNKTQTVAMDSAVDGTAGIENAKAVYWIKEVTTIVTSSETQSGNTASNTEGYTYTLNGQSVKAESVYTWNGTDFVQTTDLLDADKIAAQLATQLGSDYASSGSFVYWVGTGNPTEWDWSDSFGSQASFGFNGTIADSADLPAHIPDTLIDYYVDLPVYISGGTDDNIGYWLEYEKGVGWIESRQPGLQNNLDAATMPHVLVRDEVGTFHFVEYTEANIAAIPGAGENIGWKERVYGDETTAINPSFVGGTINDIFFHQNRLGFLSNDTVNLSSLNNYGQFYPTTVRSIIETDNIDIIVASREVQNLEYALEFADKLIVFADKTQFVIASPNGILSPASTYAVTASNYNIKPVAKPVSVGDSLYFISALGTSEHLYKYSLSTKVEGKYIATDVSLHCPTYLQGNTTKVVGHSTLGYIFLVDYASNILYLYNGTSIAEEEVQSAIHKWEFNVNIIDAMVIDNELYMVLKNGTTINLSTLDLSTPADYTIIDYRDYGTTDFDSYITFSKFVVKEQDVGSSRGRTQIRTIDYAIDDNSNYSTVIISDDIITATFSSPITTGYWSDDSTWTDAAPWIDSGYQFDRTYTDDSRITVMGNAEKTTIQFRNSVEDTEKGFNLKSVNYEVYFNQRSKRY